jgi:[1-hydroxy-2-(trimethylamino)ethyl]phosphonate dioxygenase
MTTSEILSRIDHIFTTRGGAEYHGEAVTELEHALQSALLAEQVGDSASVIAAALLHDIGHLLHGHGEDCALAGIDDRHEELGPRWLTNCFGPEVTEPIRLHVAAKRYLCAASSQYAALLSPASTRSLQLQGGPMSTEEARAFEANPHFAAAMKVRDYDDKAKVAGLSTPSIAHFRPFLELCARNGPEK